MNEGGGLIHEHKACHDVTFKSVKLYIYSTLEDALNPEVKHSVTLNKLRTKILLDL